MFVEPKATGPKTSSPFGQPRNCYYAEYVGEISQNREGELLGDYILVEHHSVAPDAPTGQDRSGHQLLEKFRGPEPRRRPQAGRIATAARTHFPAPGLGTQKVNWQFPEGR